MSLEATARLLLQPLGLVLGGGLLRIGRDLDGELHRLLERVARALVDGLDRLDVDARQVEVVHGEAELLADLLVLVEAEHGGPDYGGRVLVEVVEVDGGDGAADAAGDGLAGVADKVGHAEDRAHVGRVGGVVLEVPVERDLEKGCLVVISIIVVY